MTDVDENNPEATWLALGIPYPPIYGVVFKFDGSVASVEETVAFLAESPRSSDRAWAARAAVILKGLGEE